MRTAGCAGTARPGVTSARGHPRGAREPPVPGLGRLPAPRAPPAPVLRRLSVSRCAVSPSPGSATCPRAMSPPRPQMCHLLSGSIAALCPDVPPPRPRAPPVHTQCRLSVPERTTCPLAMSLLCPQMCHLPLSSATFLSPDVAPALKQCHIPVPSCATRPHAVSHPCPQMCHLPEPSRCHPDHHQRYHLSLMPCTGSVMVLLPSVAPLHGISITISGSTCPLCHATLTCVTNLTPQHGATCMHHPTGVASIGGQCHP